MSSRVVSPPFFSIVSSLHLTMILVKPRSPRPRPLGVPQDYAEAAKWYRLAAEQNNAAAQYNLSLMYANGQGVPRDDGEAVNAAFRYFGGVPRSILYDNTTLAVARILGDGRRKRTRVFSELQSHYLFADGCAKPVTRAT